MSLYMQGELTLALQHFKQGIALFEPHMHQYPSVNSPDPRVKCLSHGSCTLWVLGYLVYRRVRHQRPARSEDAARRTTVTEMRKTKKRRAVQYADHLRLRLALRKIPEQLPRKIYQRAKEQFFDTVTHHCVRVDRARYAGKLREMAVSFEETEKAILLITIHPLKARQKTNRIHSGRWIPYEKKEE